MCIRQLIVVWFLLKFQLNSFVRVAGMEMRAPALLDLALYFCDFPFQVTNRNSAGTGVIHAISALGQHLITAVSNNKKSHTSHSYHYLPHSTTHAHTHTHLHWHIHTYFCATLITIHSFSFLARIGWHNVKF